MSVFPLQDAYVRGEISPRLHARASLDLYRAGLSLCENFITLPHGGLRKRSGTYFVDETKDSGYARGIPFIFSETQAYLLVFTHQTFRVYAYSGAVESGGSVVEVNTPYSGTEDANHIRDLQFVQSADVLWITHPSYPIHRVTRDDHTSWSIEEETFDDGPFGSQNTDETQKMYVSATTGSITITSDFDVFTDEDIGKLIKIGMESYTGIVPWESDRTMAEASSLGTTRVRYNGNVYSGSVSTVSGASVIATGATPPTHLKGTETDGPARLDADRYIGIPWTYLHSGYGVARITARTDARTVSASVLARFPEEVVGSGNSSWVWSLGAFGQSPGYPGSTTIFEERLMFGQKFATYGSKNNGYDKFRTGPLDDDAISFQNASTSDITWLSELGGFLLIGTIGGIRTLAGSGTDEALTPTSFKNRESPSKRCCSIPPVKAGAAFLYVGYDRTSVVEAQFSLERNGFLTPSLSIISEHIPKQGQGIVALAYQEEPDPLFWMALVSGELAGLTYEQDQNVRGWHRHKMGGSIETTGNGIVEDVVVTPGQSTADDVWLIVKREINGQTKRYIETLRSSFEYGEAEDAYMVDCGLTYEGAAEDTFGGLGHLEGETVDVLADGVKYRGLTVSGGQVTLPTTATKAHIGLPYVSEAHSLELDVGGRDGSLMGRSKRVSHVILSLFETDLTGLEVASVQNGRWESVKLPSIATRTGDVTLFTGNVPVPIDDSWAGQGKIKIRHSGPTPATIRAATPAYDFAP